MFPTATAAGNSSRSHRRLNSIHTHIHIPIGLDWIEVKMLLVLFRFLSFLLYAIFLGSPKISQCLSFSIHTYTHIKHSRCSLYDSFVLFIVVVVVVVCQRSFVSYKFYPKIFSPNVQVISIERQTEEYAYKDSSVMLMLLPPPLLLSVSVWVSQSTA